jgi:hypothetical protein
LRGANDKYKGIQPFHASSSSAGQWKIANAYFGWRQPGQTQWGRKFYGKSDLYSSFQLSRLVAIRSKQFLMLHTTGMTLSTSKCEFQN